MNLARAAYTAFVWGATPLAAAYLLWRSRKQPEYRAHWDERFGFADYEKRRAGSPRPLIWIHAVSVGETRAAEPLIDALAVRFPGHDFLLTHMTPTGRATGESIVARLPDRVSQVYLPYDLPFAVRRFLAALRPAIGIAIETEAWPNLLACARQAGVIMVLVNARLSEKSLKRALRTPNLMREAAANFSLVLAQGKADAARMRSVGATDVEVVGNLKFDYTPPPQQVKQGSELRAALGLRPVLLFASTREGEEALIIDAAQALPADALLIVVPRHPQRFEEVARLLAARGALLRRSGCADLNALSSRLQGERPRFLLGDSMGEMALYYAASDVALVGGSLLPHGGQNLIEAAAVGTPVVVGPHTFNFAQAAEDAIGAGAALRVTNADDAVTQMWTLAQDPVRLSAMGHAALAFAAAHRGATARTVARLVPLIEAALAPELARSAPADAAA
jgi:3-deoxy-D-manno-octulosonic-acid transferase